MYHRVSNQNEWRISEADGSCGMEVMEWVLVDVLRRRYPYEYASDGEGYIFAFAGNPESPPFRFSYHMHV